MNSIRKPKHLTIRGDDEKEHVPSEGRGGPPYGSEN